MEPLAPINSSGVKAVLTRVNAILNAAPGEPLVRCDGCCQWVPWSDINPSLWGLCRECESDMIGAAAA